MKYTAALLAGITVIVALVLTLNMSAADAKLSLAVGPHFGFANRFAPHIGPVYYTPGDRATAAASQKAESAPTELDQFLTGIRREAKKAKCAKLHAQYVGRHGVTTPTPLKGMQGCAKYARDEAYWQTRRGERQTVTTPKNQIIYTAHDAVFNW